MATMVLNDRESLQKVAVGCEEQKRREGAWLRRCCGLVKLVI